MTNVVIHEETAAGGRESEISISLPSENVSVEELIRSRVYQQVKDANVQAAQNEAAGDTADKLVPASAKELSLNGGRANHKAPIEWSAQFDRAIAAFEKKQILIFVDERQLTSLDERIEINASSRISFVRLTMLMGG